MHGRMHAYLERLLHVQHTPFLISLPHACMDACRNAHLGRESLRWEAGHLPGYYHVKTGRRSERVGLDLVHAEHEVRHTLSSRKRGPGVRMVVWRMFAGRGLCAEGCM